MSDKISLGKLLELGHPRSCELRRPRFVNGIVAMARSEDVFHFVFDVPSFWSGPPSFGPVLSRGCRSARTNDLEHVFRTELASDQYENDIGHAINTNGFSSGSQ